MRYNPDIHHRRSIRLRDYDYAQAGAYFVTVCTFKRECLFDEDPFRAAAELVWRNVAACSGRLLDEFVVMPNHVHGIIWIPAAPAPVPVGAQQHTHTSSNPELRFGRTTATALNH
ncbi:MAG: hypothetical protein ACE5FA_15060, partial [Dehalococcoidia bacterium]